MINRASFLINHLFIVSSAPLCSMAVAGLGMVFVYLTCRKVFPSCWRNEKILFPVGWALSTWSKWKEIRRNDKQETEDILTLSDWDSHDPGDLARFHAFFGQQVWYESREKVSSQSRYLHSFLDETVKFKIQELNEGSYQWSTDMLSKTYLELKAFSLWGIWPSTIACSSFSK